MITYPVSSNLCNESSLQCYRLYNFSFFRSWHWKYSVRKSILGNFAKFTGKQLRQSLFLNKVAGWGNCSWPFLRLLPKISCLFNFNWKMRCKKENTLMEFKYLLFCLSIDLFDVKRFKRNLTDGRGGWDGGRWTLDEL